MTPSPDDFALMQRIADGDRTALDLLYRRYAAVVFSVALRICNDRGTAEDLLIDVFFELWHRADRYDPNRGAPLTYITTLARSRAIDRKRGKSARWAHLNEGPLEGLNQSKPAEDAAPSPHDHAVLAEQASVVRAALRQLEPEHRQMIELSYFEGLSHSQIAEKLQKPLGTVKTHIRMGIIRMRELLRMPSSRDKNVGV